MVVVVVSPLVEWTSLYSTHSTHLDINLSNEKHSIFLKIQVCFIFNRCRSSYLKCFKFGIILFGSKLTLSKYLLHFSKYFHYLICQISNISRCVHKICDFWLSFRLENEKSIIFFSIPFLTQTIHTKIVWVPKMRFKSQNEK